MKKICKLCFTYHKDSCQEVRKEWSTYVREFAAENVRIPTSYITRQVKENQDWDNGSLVEEADGVDDSGIADSSVTEGGDRVKNQENNKESLQWRWKGDSNWNDNPVKEEGREDGVGLGDDLDAEALDEDQCDRNIDNVTYDGVEDQCSDEENGNEIDCDGESDVEEMSEEQKIKLLEEDVTGQAKFLYSKLVINKGKKYADKFKGHLNDIAREQIIEDLEKRKQERLNRQ